MRTSTLISRRQFFIRGTQVAGAAAGATLLAPLAAYAAPSEVPAAINLMPVLKWLGAFARDIAADVVPQLILDWLGSDETAAQSAASVAAGSVEDQGFSNYQNSSVFNVTNTTNNTYMFGVTNQENFQALAPFVYNTNNGYEYAILGGPAIMALSPLLQRLIQNYPRADRSVLSSFVLPSGVGTTNYVNFAFNDTWAMWYPTCYGWVEMQYIVRSFPHMDRGQLMAGQGTLQTVVRDRRTTYAGVGQTIYYV